MHFRASKTGGRDLPIELQSKGDLYNDSGRPSHPVMTMRAAAALAGAILLIGTAVGQAPPPVPENAPAPADKEFADSGLVPVALTGSPDVLVVGVLVRSIHPAARGKLRVCLPAVSSRSPRGIYGWIDDGSGNPSWQPCSITHRHSNTLLICTVADNPAVPAMDVDSLKPLPKTLDHLVVAEWSVLPAVANANPDQPATLENQLRNEFRLLNEEYQLLNRPPRAGSENLTPEERRRKILEVTRQLREVRTEAAQNRIRLTSPARRAGPPEQGALLREIPVQGRLEGAAGKTTLTLQEAVLEPTAAVPHLLLAAEPGVSMRVHSLLEVAKIVDPPEQLATAYLDLPESSDPTLHVQPSPHPPLVEPPLVEVVAAPGRELPADLTKALLKASASSNRPVKLRIPRAAIVPGQPIKIAWSLRHRDVEEPEVLEPFQITFTKKKNGSHLAPQVTDSEGLTWRAPASSASPDLPPAPLLTSLETEGAIGDDLHLWSDSGLLVTLAKSRHHLLFRNLSSVSGDSE